MRVFLASIKKYAQTAASSPQIFNPKYNRPIKMQIADINLAISDLNSVKTLVKPNETAAISCINKTILYLSWLVRTGLGGEVSAAGKNMTIPSVDEFRSLIRTGVFGERFILSLATILKLNDSNPLFKNDFAKLRTATPQ